MFLVLACPCLSLLVHAALHLRVGACWVLPKGGRGLGFAPIRGLGMGLGRWLGCGYGRGVRWGIHLHGGGPRGTFGLGLRGLLSLRLGFRFGLLGGRLSRRVIVRLGIRLLFGLGGLLTCSCSLLLLSMGHSCSMRGIQQMPLNPKHLLFPWVFHPHSPPVPRRNPPQPPGTHHRCRAHTPAHQAGGQVTHPPPKRGAPRVAFAAAAASASPSHGDVGVPGPTTSCCPIRRACASVGGSFWVAWVRGGPRQAVWVSRRGRALLGRRCGGWPCTLREPAV